METHIIIVGAGYAGLMCALRVAGKSKRLGTRVTLINGSNVFVERPLLHEVAANQLKEQTPIAEMIRDTGINFVQGWMTAIEPDKNSMTVTTTDGQQNFRYDYLVYAVGSMVDRENVQGAAEYAYALNPYGENAAEALREKLLQTPDGRVVVIGGGATGIEGATQIHAIYPQLDMVLVTRGRFAAFKGERVEHHIRDGFAKQGITVLENQVVASVQDKQLVMNNGDTLSYDVCLWAGGFIAPTHARDAGIRVNDRNQILADPYLRSISHPNIYVVGDAAAPVEEPGNHYRLSLVVALTTGAHVADNIVRVLKNKPQQPLSFVYYGQGIAMGTEDAVGFGGFPDDEAGRIIVRGKAAVHVRNFFVWLIKQMLLLERRFPGFYMWLGKGRYAAQQKRRHAQTLEGQSV
jgi:NADH:ubiquinone reductase (H+-translocating)